MTALRAQHHPDCYPSNTADALAFFRKAFGALPTDLRPVASGQDPLPGILTPHIDFRVSLPSYAAAFRPLLDEPLAETYLILGVGHRSRLEWNLDRRDYLTPLGRAECATDLVNALTDGVSPAFHFSPQAHEGEHSIEFPLLWLQALHQLRADPGGKAKPVRFVPLLCGGLHGYIEEFEEWDDLHEFLRLSHALAALFEKYPPGEKLRIIVSIDGCHIGSRFDHPFPVTAALLQATAGWEEKLWAVVAQGDAKAFLEWMREEGNDRYFDGVGALALLLASGKFTVQRTHYEQWFTERDASAVTFSSGYILRQ